MKALLAMQKRLGHFFEKGGPLEFFYPLFEAHDTFLFTPDTVTENAPHVRDGIDLKRLMITVVIALSPCMLWAMYNTGYQAHLAIEAGCRPLDNWRTSIFTGLGFEFSSRSVLACFVHGALYFLPVYVVTLIAGGLVEVIFALVRRHEINEGFLVTSALFPLTLPATIPLWQVALGIIFGVFVGKEVFGGVGMNIFNPALMSRAFLYFAYPGQITGDNVWVAAQTTPDGYSGATWLSVVKEKGMAGFANPELGVAHTDLTWWRAFVGLEPGSMGETSMLLCLVGAAILIATGVGSWRTIVGCFVGSALMAEFFHLLGILKLGTNPYYSVPFFWHWVIGGFGFAAVFMATDPVSSPFTEKGKLIYGLLIGSFGILIREVNPAYPGSWMLAILFMNMFSPLIDYFIVQAHIRRRIARYAA